MIALYIIFGILAFIGLLLIIPVRLKFQYSNDLKLSVSYLFFTIRLLPEKPKKEKKKTKEKPAEKKQKEKPEAESKLKNLLKQKGLSGFISIIKDIAALVGKSAYSFLKHVRLKNNDIYVRVAAEDASDAAILYGQTCAVLYPSVTLIYQFFHSTNGRITVDVDYEKKDTEIAASGSASVRPFWAAKELVLLLIKGLPYIKEFR